MCSAYWKSLQEERALRNLLLSMCLYVFNRIYVFIKGFFWGPTPQGGLMFFHATAAGSFLSISLVYVVDMYVAHARFCSREVGAGV